MMKETIKTFVIVMLAILVVLLSIKTENCYKEVRKQPETVYLTDTLTNIVYDTVYLERYKTVKLPITDTLVYYITDTVTRVDSIEVEVPISKYQFDTCLTTDTTVFNLFIQNLGYDVTLDSLHYKFEYTPTPQKTNFFKKHFKFGVGIGTGYGCFSKQPDIFLGIGFFYCF